MPIFQMTLRLKGAEMLSSSCCSFPSAQAPSPSGYLTDLSLFLHQRPPSALSSLHTAVACVQASSLVQLLGHIPHRHLHADSVFFKQIGSCLFFFLKDTSSLSLGFQGSYCILILSIQFVPCPQNASSYLLPCLRMGTSST